MPLTTLMIWTEPSNHENECYFCMMRTKGFTKKINKNNILYPNIPSARRSLPQSSDVPPPVPPNSDKIVNYVNDLC